MASSILRQTLLTADIFTSSHRFSAQINIGNRRLADVLNDRMTDFLSVQNVYVSRINAPGEIVGQYKKASLKKEHITFVVLPSESDGLSKEDNYNAFSKSSQNVFMALPSFEVTGQLNIIGKFDLKAILAIGTTRFMPIFRGNAENAFFPNVKFSGPVIVVNKQAVAFFSVLGEE